jgi:hypothetical protein
MAMLATLASALAATSLLALMGFLLLCAVRSSPGHTTRGDNLGNMAMDIITTSIYRPRFYTYVGSTPAITAMYGHLQQCFEAHMHAGMRTSWKLALLSWVLCGVRCIDKRKMYRINVSQWEYSRPDSGAFWAAHGARFRECLLRALDAPAGTGSRPVADAAVHLRLGDVPFSEWPAKVSQYHFQSAKYYDWALSRLGIVPPQTILVVYSVAWSSSQINRELSWRYVDAFTKWLERRGFLVRVQTSEDPLDDLRTLCLAKKYIGSNGAFSFVAGIGRPEDEFVLPMLGRERDEGYTLYTPAPAWMSPHPPMLKRDFRERHASYQSISDIFRLMEEL